MGIEIDFGRELGRLAFPDDVTEEQAQGYVRDNYQAIRQGLLAQRQEQLAAETTAEEAAKLRAGDIGALETVGGQLYEAPRAAGRMLGQAAKGFARIFEAGAPDIEVTPEEQAAILARSPITRAGERMVTAAEELPVIPGVEQTIPGQVMGGVGSVAGLLPATLVGGPIAGGAVYGLSAGEQAAEDARRTVNRRIAERLAIGDVAGADDLRAQLPQLEAAAFGITAPIGAVTEGALGLAGKIGRVGPGRPTIGGVGSKLAEAMIPKAASVRTQNMIRGGIEGAVTEGLQESLEQTLGNMAAKVTYDPERGVMDGVAQAGFIGAASGGFIGGTIGSRKNLGAANAVAEAVGADPGNPLPRSTATLAGIQDGPQPTGPISIEPEITPEEVLRMSQELGIPAPEEVIPTPAPAAVPTPTPEAAPAPEAVAAPAAAPEAVIPPAAPTELEPDEQAELDALIEKEAAGTLTEDDSITLSAYRARLGVAEPAAQPTPTPTPSAVQEQGADEGVLRREEPQPAVEVGLPEVDQGRRPAEGGRPEAQVTPAEVQAVKAEPQLLTIEETQEYNAGVDLGTDMMSEAELARFEELAGRVRQLERAGYEFDETTGWTKPPTPQERGARTEQLRETMAKTPAPILPAVKPATEIQAAKLPKDLAGAKPRYNYATAAFMPAFDSDFDRAAFIVTQKVPSKRDADYLNWAMTTSGLTEKQVKAHGVKVRTQLRQMAAGAKGGTQKAPVALKLAPVTIDVAPAAAPAATPAPAPSPAPAPTPAAVTTPATSGDIVNQMALWRRQKPSPLKRAYGPNPTAEQIALHKARVSAWEKEYRRLGKLHKTKLEQENANRTAKVREAVPGEPAQPPAAAGGSMQEGIDNLKFVSDPVAQVRGGGMDPKDAKVKLIQQLERALEAAPAESDRAYNDLVMAGRTAPEEHFKSVNDKNMGAGYEAKYRERHELGKKLIAKYGPSVPKITIEIPGDGTYTIANTKQAINQVLDKARSLNTSMAKGPIKAPAARQKPERAREVPMRLAQQAIQVYGKANAAAKLREQAANTDLELTDQQRTELKVAADMIAPAPALSAAQSAIDTIDKINKAISENQYSDPLFLTPLAKLALQIAKRLIQTGVAVEQAIRQAIAQAREQLPNDPANDAQLAERLVRDAQYAQAVAAGDMETAQRMVDEAAKAAGYNIGPVYHGVRERYRMGTESSPPAILPATKFNKWIASEANYPAFYASRDRSAVERWAKGPSNVMSVYLKAQNTAKEGDRIISSSFLQKDVVDKLKSLGYDSVEGGRDFYAHEIAVFDPSQIKSAEPITRDDAGNVVPLSRRFQSSTADIRGAKPDSVETALQKVITATDPKGKAFEAVTALSYVVLNQAAKIALAIYKRTKSWIAARNAGMDYIKSHVQLKNEPETANNFEEFIKGLPNQEIPAGTPELPQPPNPAERVESRGLFVGDITADTDENWASEAKKWVDFYKGNLERAFQVAMTADIDNAFREYVFADLLQRSELEVARAKNDVDLLKALNLQERIAKAEVQLGANTGKAMAARKLSQERYWWLQPALIYRNLIRKRQAEAIPFPGVVSQQVRQWLVQSGREAVDQVRDAMKQADNVFAREFRKIKAVPGAEGAIQINWSEILTKAIAEQGSVRQKMLQVMLADRRLRNLSSAGIAEITNLLTNAWEKQRDRIFTSEFRKKIPLPTVKPDNRDKLFRALPRILRYANIARATPSDVVTTDGPETFLLWDQAFRDAVAPEFGVAEINGATARKLTALAQDAQARKGVNRNEIIQQMFRLMAREGGVNFSDALRDYWYAAVLSGTRTQVDNALNILNGGLNTAMFAGMSGRDAGLIAYSALKGLDEGIRDFWPMLWRGELYRSVNFNPDQPGNALEGLGESRNLFAKGVSQMKYVSRLIQALDHVTALMSDASAKAYALRKEYGPEVARTLMMPSPDVVQAARDRAIAEGTRPELVNKRTREILQEKFPVEILLTSKEIREATTFTEVPQGLMGSVYEGLNSASRKFPALKFITGTNFVRFAANYTNELLNYAAPVAAWRWFQSAPGRSDGPLGLNYSESRRDLLLAKAAIGTALGAFAAAMFLGDDDKEEDRNIDITGSFKSLDPNKRKQLLAEGRQPYSIRFGNTYVSYRQLGFGGLLGAIGELRDRQLFSPDKWSKESITDKVLDAGAAGMFIVKDSSAISGLTEFLGFANAYKYDTNEVIEKAVPRYVARLAGSLVPNILKEVDAWSDPSIFKAEGGNLGYEYFLQQVPYARREIGPGPILNVLGEPVQIERYPYSRWITQRQDDKAWDTLGRLASRGVFMPTPAITVKVSENGKRREMTREEKYEYQRSVGEGYRKFIEQNSERLLKMTPAQASDYIDKNADRIRRDARGKLKNSF